MPRSNGAISAALPLEDLLEGAKALVRPWVGKGRKPGGKLSTMGAIKGRLYGAAVAALRAPRDSGASKL